MNTPSGDCQVCGSSLDPSASFCPSCGAARGQHRPADPMVGRTIIGQYVVRSRLGEGGMGAVYLADQPSVGRQAVVKVMHPGLSADPAVAPRFEVEARAASQLNHPNIITIYNYGAMEDGTLFLAMEYINGPSLEDVVGKEPLSPGRVAAIGAQICDALAEAHRRGVVHRDLKPSNIMLAKVGRQEDFVKVLDFGIAKVEGVKMTRTGSVIGTPQYMSPEQLKGESLDGRSDLYALGGILYQMVSGELPFQAETAAGFMHKHLNEPPVPPALRNPAVNVPPALEAVILRSLGKEPDERFQDADEMARALERCRDGAVPLTAQSSAAIVAVPDQRSGRIGLWIALAASLVVLIAAGATALWFFGLRHEPAGDAAVRAPSEKVAWRHVSGPREALEEPVETTVDAGHNAPPAATETRPAEKIRRPKKRAKKPVKLAMNRDTSGSTAARSSAPTVAPTPAPAPAPTPPPPAKAPPGGNKSAKKLEQELRRVLRNAKVPPSVVDKTFEGYTNAQAFWPQKNREQLRKRYLAQLLKAYSKPQLQLKPFERRPLPQLRKIFLTMDTKAKLSSEQKTRILNQALKTYDSGNFSPKDRTFYKRMALVSMIKNMASNPAKVMR